MALKPTGVGKRTFATLILFNRSCIRRLVYWRHGFLVFLPTIFVVAGHVDAKVARGSLSFRRGSQADSILRELFEQR